MATHIRIGGHPYQVAFPSRQAGSVRSGLANDVLRCVRDQQRKPFEITPQLEAWLLETADQPATPLTKADFDGIRQRARKRTPASGA